jgi:gamma-glutamylcyclotransferase (GGCT)/AIG2-like uncharacterized protein YtfP
MLTRGKCTLVKKARLDNARLFDFGAFPGMRLGRGSGVSGEIWRLPDSHEDRASCLVTLDRYEGVSSGFYSRKEVEIEGIVCYTYEYCADGNNLIVSGEWK